MITQETIDKIIGAARIEEVVSDFVKLRKRGTNYIGNCPFHDEKTPSFTVSPTKEIYKCFGCGKAGNSVSFIMEHEHASYPEALRYLADKYHIPIEETISSPEQQEQKTLRESMHILLSAAQKFYTDAMMQSEEGKNIALTYFKERDLKPHIMESFGLGWAPSSRDAFSNWALKNGYNKELLLLTGLAFETAEGQRLLDKFHERVMFPIHNISGKVVGFGGRIIKSNAKEAKYINSPETEVYSKSKILYGMFQAKKAVADHDSCILVEGYMDVLSLVQAGIGYVAASSGTSLTEEQLKIVKRYTENVTLFYDGDDAGQKASMRAIDLALAQDINIKVVSLPLEEDPDSFARKHDKEEIEEFIKKNALDFVRFKAKNLLPDGQTDPIIKAKAAREIITSVALIPDSLKRNLFVREAANVLQMKEEELHDELRRILAGKMRDANKGGGEIRTETTAPAQMPLVDFYSGVIQEERVLRNLLMFGDKQFTEEQTVGEFILSQLTDADWENVQCRKLYEEVKKVHEEGGGFPGFSLFVNNEDQSFQQFIANMMSDKHSLAEGWAKFLGRPITSAEENYREEINSSINYFTLKKIEQMIGQNDEELKKADAEKDIDKSIGSLQLKQHLNEMRSTLMKQMGITVR